MEHYDTTTGRGQRLERELQSFLLRNCSYCAHPKKYHDASTGFCKVCRVIAEDDDEYETGCL